MRKLLATPCSLVIVASLLCACGEVDGDAALVEALADGNDKQAKTLQSEGADPSRALTLAIRTGRVDTVPALLDLGADPLTKDSDGTPAIAFAAKLGHAKGVAALAERMSTVANRMRVEGPRSCGRRRSVTGMS